MNEIIPKNIIIEQAIFGEKNKGYFLLDTTLQDNSLSSEIAAYTDLLDRPQTNENWISALRAFPYKSYYILFRTYADNSPNVRNGRVFSHALMIKMEDIADINNLFSLIEYFPKTLDKSIKLSSIKYTNQEYIVPNSLISRISCVLKALFNDSNVIIWEGQNDFEHLVSCIWKGLWAEKRQQLHIGITFNPQKINITKFQFLCTSNNGSIETRKFKDYSLILKNDTYTISLLSEYYLVGNVIESKALVYFMKEFNLTPTTFKDLEKWERMAIPIYNLAEIQTFSAIYGLITAIHSISPNPENHVEIKNRILNKQIELLKNANLKEVRAIKNIITSPFNNGIFLLKNALYQWCEEKLFIENSIINDISLAVSTILQEPKSWWSETFSEFMNNKVHNWQRKYANYIAVWFAENMEVIPFFENLIPSTSENDFIDYYQTNIPGNLVDNLLKLSSQKRWYRLHATLLTHYKSIKDAIKLQLGIDKDVNSEEGIRILSKSVSPENFIEAIVVFEDKRLFVIAAEYCHKEPNLLNKIDISIPTWQQIWSYSLQKGNTISDGIAYPQNIIFCLLEELLNYRYANEDLLSVISTSNFANIWEYPNRQFIWDKLPIKVKNNFLVKTSKEYIQRFENNEELEKPEKVLQDKILSNEILCDYFLRKNSQNMPIVVQMFETFSTLPERYFRDYIFYFNGHLTAVDATVLGTFIQKRNWDDIANIIKDKRSNNRESIWNYTLKECYDILSWWAKAELFLKGFSSDIKLNSKDWWISFEEIATELYSKGPEKIWEKAGGEESDLLSKGSGKEIWRDAIKKMKNGIKGVSIKRFIKEMRSDFPKNERLIILYDLYKELWKNDL